MVACAAVTGIVEIPAEPPSPDPGMRGERESLLGWLWYQRAAFARKVRRTHARTTRRDEHPAFSTVPPRARAPLERDGTLSFRRGVGGEPLAPIYCTDTDPEADFERAATADPGETFAIWRRERDGADAVIAAVAALDRPGAGHGRTLRWSLLKIIAEYARHNGHADLLRERLDGTKSE